MDTLQQMGPGGLVIGDDGSIDLNATARSLLETLLNAVMIEQASELGGARNGYRTRTLDTAVGRITLRIPKLREGTYFPDDIITRWSRTDTALAATACEMWIGGVSTRKIEKVLSSMGVERLSKSRVSRLAQSLDLEVAGLRSGTLSAEPSPYLWLDATYIPCRQEGRTQHCALACAIALGEDGRRKIVGIECVETESYLSWHSFLSSLRRRGLSGVKLVISDAHEGLARAAREVFPSASWQRCVAHLERNVRERCRKKAVGSAVTAALKQAFRFDEPALIEAGYDRAIELLEEKDPRGAELLDDAKAAALCFLDFPREHAKWIRTNNVQERFNAEIKRRTKVVQVFPSVASMVRMVGSICCDQNDKWIYSIPIDARPFRDDYETEPVREIEPRDMIEAMFLVEEAFDKELKAA